jgi:uncharacterized protein (DUF1810 family)
MTGEDLERFVTAQDSGAVYARALAELRAGRKQSHWMWFVFPQIAGLGRSEVARRYAINGLGEARRYLRHPILGERLREASRTLLDHTDRRAEEIMGAVDAMKLRSSMTLFAHAAGRERAQHPQERAQHPQERAQHPQERAEHPQESTSDQTEQLFRRVLEAFYGGSEDPATVERL